MEYWRENTQYSPIPGEWKSEMIMNSFTPDILTRWDILDLCSDLSRYTFGVELGL